MFPDIEFIVYVRYIEDTLSEVLHLGVQNASYRYADVVCRNDGARLIPLCHFVPE